MKYLALAVSTLAYMAWFYGVYLMRIDPFVYHGDFIGLIFLIPAVIWWGVSLVSLGKQRKWIWMVSCLILLPLGPLVYDMYRARASTN